MLGTLEHIQSCHTEAHSILFGTDMIHKQGLAGQVLNCLIDDFVLCQCLLKSILWMGLFLTMNKNYFLWSGSKYKWNSQQVDSVAMWRPRSWQWHLLEWASHLHRCQVCCGYCGGAGQQDCHQPVTEWVWNSQTSRYGHFDRTMAMLGLSKIFP